MYGRTATSRCRICRSLGILPVFLLGCVVAWLAASATGWVWSILAFVLTLVCGALSLRAGCQLAFPDRPVLDLKSYAAPELFSPFPIDASAKVDEISPGQIDELLAETSSKFAATDHAGEGEKTGDSEEPIIADNNIFEDPVVVEPEQESEDEPALPDELSQEADPDGLDYTAEDLTEDFGDPGADDEFSQEVERLLQQDSSAAAVEEDLEDALEIEPNLPVIEEETYQPQPNSERPKGFGLDPGRRLAQNLVMVGASPALTRMPLSSSSQSLRPASLHSARTTGSDDLKLIRGVGDALEELLHALGYFHFDQIAAWTPEEVQWVDENLVGFKGRVSRDHWVSQAILLANSHRSSDEEADMAPNLRPTHPPESNS